MKGKKVPTAAEFMAARVAARKNPICCMMPPALAKEIDAIVNVSKRDGGGFLPAAEYASGEWDYQISHLTLLRHYKQHVRADAAKKKR